MHAARPIVAFAISLLTLTWLLRSGVAAKILDRPNDRSLHRNPTPRIGGVAMLAGMLCGWMGIDSAQLALVVAATAALAWVSFLDDLRHLPVWQRFFAHFLAASAGVLWLSGGQSWLVLIAVILAIVWMTNLFNFMDGADGLAGGMALFGFTSFTLQAAAMGDAAFASLNAVIAAAALGFLLFNFHPARVFMGDAGSIPLGFLAGLIGFIGWTNGVWPAWFPALVFSPFIVDATVTLFKRLLRGERIWQAHREHYYQRLILLGHGHRKTAWLEYALMFTVDVSALWGAWQSSTDQAILLGGWVIVYMVLTLQIDRLWSGAGKKTK
ncbi:MAG: glycosyltransferase family 4 protein [Hydrogenophilales bacterium]|nr:glycosyltransferase family 4 protein [Hydrogenophilales bacterium]